MKYRWSVMLSTLGGCATGYPSGDVDVVDATTSDAPGPDAVGARADAATSPDAATSSQAVTLTQSSTMAITAANSLRCSASGVARETSYYRVFRLADHGVTRPLTVSRVSFGVQEAVAGTGGQQTMDVRLHRLNGTLLVTNLSQIATATVTVPDSASGTVVAVELTAPPIPADATLVIEVFTDTAVTTGHQFLLGSNSATESSPGYIRAPQCGNAQPATFASLGFASTHIVITADGTF